MQEEVWKDVVGYEEYFQVSSFGRVYSKRSNKVLKNFIRKDRRVTIATKIGGRAGTILCFKVHRLVAEAFIPNPEGKLTVNHKDGNPSNNSCDNLEWATYSENTIHAYQTGLIVPLRGRDNGLSKLSKEDISAIRSNYSKTIREIAEEMGVHHSTVSRCATKKRYN